MLIFNWPLFGDWDLLHQFIYYKAEILYPEAVTASWSNSIIIFWLNNHYENLPIQIYWKVNHRKIENFQTKNSNIFHISAQNIDCGYPLELPRRGGTNKYPQSMFWAEIRKIMYTPVNPSFTI